METIERPLATIVTDAYETTTSRLKSVTDALSQVKTYSYAKDDRLLGVAYTGAVNPTPNVGFAWDPYFPRLASRTDGAGTTQFTYVPGGLAGRPAGAAGIRPVRQQRHHLGL